MICFANSECCQKFSEDVSVIKQKRVYNRTNKEVRDAIIRASDLFFTLCLCMKEMNVTYCVKGSGQALPGLRREQTGQSRLSSALEVQKRNQNQ